MEEQHIEAIKLANNLQLDIYDASRPVAGDRWRVQMIARIHIRVDSIWEAEDPGIPTKSTVKELIGDELVFERKNTRHFIDEGEKDAVFQSMRDSFRHHSLGYLSHPEFARQFVLKAFQDKQKERKGQSSRK
ncbi:MAG: hypothetical protein KGY61_02370 [Desulfobacterales bacterium]|nr:hypothetical protein [Desulfobacterales bacterium]